MNLRGFWPPRAAAVKQFAPQKQKAEEF